MLQMTQACQANGAASAKKHYNYFRDYDASVGRYIQSDPLGLRAGPNTFGYVGGNPLINLDPTGLLNWSYQGTSWSNNLGPGSTYSPYPGGAQISLPGNVGGATGIDWSINAERECVGGGFRLKEFSVRLTTFVQLRNSYPRGPDQAAWSARAEGDHVSDINMWQGGDGRGAAAAAEQSAKGRQFGSAKECEAWSVAYMNSALTTSFQGAAASSHNRWDRWGQHNYNSPRRRP